MQRCVVLPHHKRRLRNVDFDRHIAVGFEKDVEAPDFEEVDFRGPS